MGFLKRLFGGSGKHPTSQGLTLTKKNNMLGFLQDKDGTVRGFWFPTEQQASDSMLLRAVIATYGETVEQSDYIACFAGLCKVQPAEGGYLVVFPSAKF
jgi:hypothetical protein